ncbi:MAG TPA: helix-turn-helix transcriptional regulator [Jatrophihabitantaceae bacterium]|jgi:transcriptional regulator with XRE-family HTH domain
MTSDDDTTLGGYLKRLRTVAALTLREVEERTGGEVKNGYLSQIENHQIGRPSPEVLWQLSQTYGVDYNDLLGRAGHRTVDPSGARQTSLAGIPLSAIEELDEDDRKSIVDYIEFLRTKKKRAGT